MLRFPNKNSKYHDNIIQIQESLLRRWEILNLFYITAGGRSRSPRGQLKEISLFDNEDLSSNGQADLKDSTNENVKQRTDMHV